MGDEVVSRGHDGCRKQLLAVRVENCDHPNKNGLGHISLNGLFIEMTKAANQ